MGGSGARWRFRQGAVGAPGERGATAGPERATPVPANGSRHRSLVAATDAGAAARREIDDAAAGVEREVVDRSRVVVTELVANAVRHAGLRKAQRIDLGVSVLTELVRIEVADDGRGFDPIARKPRPRQESGWGLWLVEQLTDRWGVDRGPGARVWCEFDRPGGLGGRAATRTGVRQAQQRRLSVHAVGAFLAEEAGAASYRRAQRDALRGRVTRSGARPLEFDESGFPIPQRASGFVERVARLLKP
jgi:anti-sigma regulatory factor (Ser/Thr protein kinase)